MPAMMGVREVEDIVDCHSGARDVEWEEGKRARYVEDFGGTKKCDTGERHFMDNRKAARGSPAEDSPMWQVPKMAVRGRYFRRWTSRRQ